MFKPLNINKWLILLLISIILATIFWSMIQVPLVVSLNEIYIFIFIYYYYYKCPNVCFPKCSYVCLSAWMCVYLLLCVKISVITLRCENWQLELGPIYHSSNVPEGGGEGGGRGRGGGGGEIKISKPQALIFLSCTCPIYLDHWPAIGKICMHLNNPASY